MGKFADFNKAYVDKAKGILTGIKNFVMVAYPVLLTILIIAIVAIPIYLLKKYLKTKNQTIRIFPKFEIADIQNTNAPVDLNQSESAIKTAEEILKRIQGLQKK